MQVSAVFLIKRRGKGEPDRLRWQRFERKQCVSSLGWFFLGGNLVSLGYILLFKGLSPLLHTWHPRPAVSVSILYKVGSHLCTLQVIKEYFVTDQGQAWSNMIPVTGVTTVETIPCFLYDNQVYWMLNARVRCVELNIDMYIVLQPQLLPSLHVKELILGKLHWHHSIAWGCASC